MKCKIYRFTQICEDVNDIFFMVGIDILVRSHIMLDYTVRPHDVVLGDVGVEGDHEECLGGGYVETVPIVSPGRRGAVSKYI